MNYFIASFIFCYSVANAGGVETSPAFMTLTENFTTSIPSENSFQPFMSPELLLKLKDMTLRAELFAAESADGGVETLMMKYAEMPLMSLNIQEINEISLQRIRYAGEVDGAVIVNVNNDGTTVQIENSEIDKSPGIEAAIRASIQASDWSQLP